MSSESRRNFVKKSIVASILAAQPSIMAGLVRASGGGEETTTGGTTTDPMSTTGGSWQSTGVWSTSPPQTTLPPGSYDTTWDPIETTVVVSTLETTLVSTDYYTTAKKDSKKRRWECKLTVLGPRDTAYTPQQLEDAHNNFSGGHPGYWQGDPQGAPSGSHYISGPETLEEWDPKRPEEGVMITRYRVPQPPKMKNWQDPKTKKFFAAYVYDYIELEYEIEIPDEP